MIDPVMIFCVSGVAFMVALLVVFGSWVEAVAKSEAEIIGVLMRTDEDKE